MRTIGSTAFWVSGSPVIIGLENVPPIGPCLLAATHQSPFDVALLIRHTPRLLDFVSITEVFRNPIVAWFYGSLNAFPLDRSRPDSKTVRVILDRLERSRAVAIFPEGGFRQGRESVVFSRRIRSGTGRIASIAGAPVIPCVLIDSQAYNRPSSWLPRRSTRYGVIYGPPIDPALAPEAIESRLVDEFVALHGRLSAAMTRV
ncbi:MAG: lysophospholipid acyltransferase family protein [Phycisphaerales bacterium]|nr:lysophospholipid acyltransferase family protein [Phycisphaerales bacterium]